MTRWALMRRDTYAAPGVKLSERRWAFLSRKVIGRQDNPMLIRWRLLQTPIGGIYLHFIAREDLDRMPHDHPWTFASIILRGGYVEQYWDDSRLVHTQDAPTPRIWRAGRHLHVFRQRAAHRIIEVLPHTTTLVFVGPKTRTWGFYSARGFIDWRDYHAVANGWSDQQRAEMIQ